MTISDILLALKFWWWGVLLAVLVAAVPTFAIADGRDPLYESSGRYVLAPAALENPNDVVDATGTLDGSSLVATFSEILESTSARTAVRIALDLDVREIAQYEVDAAVIPEALAVEFFVIGPKPELTRIVAEQLAVAAAADFEALYPVYRAQLITAPAEEAVARPSNALRDALLAGIAAGAVAVVVVVSLDRRRRQRWELAPVTTVRVESGDAPSGGAPGVRAPD